MGSIETRHDARREALSLLLLAWMSAACGGDARSADAATASGGGGATAPMSAASSGNAAPASASAGGGASGGTHAGPAGAASTARAGMSAPAAGGGGVPSAGASGGMHAGGGGVSGEAAGSAGMPAAGSGSEPISSGLPKVMTTDGDGPFEVTQNLSSGPEGQSGLFYPTKLGENGVKHPIFVWGCGGTATPSSYANELKRIASHGFVVIAEVSNIGDDGKPLLAAADWIVAENARQGSELYGMLDTTRLGLGGHSIGSVNSFLAGVDKRWTTTVHVAGGSLDDVNDPNAPTTGMGGKNLIHPTAYICSENDVFGNVEKTQKDYDNTTVPVFFTIIAGADHVGATMAGLPVLIAWLRWQLAGETEWRGDFLDPQGQFCTGKYMSHSKNWN
jgi:hypothetical protein